jgi:hypothetical protein
MFSFFFLNKKTDFRFNVEDKKVSRPRFKCFIRAAAERDHILFADQTSDMFTTIFAVIKTNLFPIQFKQKLWPAITALR